MTSFTRDDLQTAMQSLHWTAFKYHADDYSDLADELFSALEAASPPAASGLREERPPTRRDLAETLCFLDHGHDEPSCPKGRHEADRIVRALSARYQSRATEARAALAETPGGEK